MNKKIKWVLSTATCLLFVISVLSSAVNVSAEKRLEMYREASTNLGWYWKPPYPNYAPCGMPDFDQKQDEWKSIFPGPDGVLQSTPNPASDDVVSPNGLRIAPGPNCKLETTPAPASDDFVGWSFCGPTAVANCFWWFDSKYADPTGTPGDGNDRFPLVKDYTVGDDHSKANVPKFICKLANAMKTCSKGTTYIDDMQDAIDEWFEDTGLEHMFEENTYNKPTFEFIEEEIERSQDVILLLGYYDRGDKIVDQNQTLYTDSELIPHLPGEPWQKFFPTVNVLDAVQVVLSGLHPGNITVWIYDATNFLGSSTRSLPTTIWPEWFQFHFEPSIELNPGLPYYIKISAEKIDWFWHFWAGPFDNYDGRDTSSLEPHEDFTFKTEYYECERRGGHYVTCAGVNSEEKKIAFSDPYWDVQNPAATDHNDAKNVSHDIYNVTEGSPCLNYDYKWWLPDYPSYHDYTIVEQAFIICPKPLKPDLDCEGELSWSDVKPGSTVTGTIYVKNVGAPFSELDWIVGGKPIWGTWTFNPFSGENLRPEDGKLKVQVTVVAPTEKNKQFTGQIIIYSMENITDNCIIQVSLTTPKNKQSINPYLSILEKLFERFPELEQLFSHMFFRIQ